MGDVAVVLRAYRFALDPNPQQEATLLRHSGQARRAYNLALATRIAAYQHLQRLAEARVQDFGETLREARERVVKTSRSTGELILVPQRSIDGVPEIDCKVPATIGNTQMGLNATLSTLRKRDKAQDLAGLPHAGWHQVNRHAQKSGFRQCDVAFNNFFDSQSGKRAQKLGFPKFKKRGHAQDRFTLYGLAELPIPRRNGSKALHFKKLLLPTIGAVKIHGNCRRLARTLQRVACDQGGWKISASRVRPLPDGRAAAARVVSVTVSRHGCRWYASILVQEELRVPVASTPRQHRGGSVGVDLGIRTTLALSNGQLLTRPSFATAYRRKVARLQRKLSIKLKLQEAKSPRSKRAYIAALRVANAKHQEAMARATWTHCATKYIATSFSLVGMENLNVAGMSASSRDVNGVRLRRSRQAAGFNRAILDANFAEIRRQLEYKTVWYGAEFVQISRWFPSSKTCNQCGQVKSKLGRGERLFLCEHCGWTGDRDVNAAVNIRNEAVRLHQSSPATSGRVETRVLECEVVAKLQHCEVLVHHQDSAKGREGPEHGPPSLHK